VAGAGPPPPHPSPPEGDCVTAVNNDHPGHHRRRGRPGRPRCRMWSHPQLSERGMGKPGFPIPPPGGRVWEGAALPGSMFIPVGVRREPHRWPAAGWRTPARRAGIWGNPVPHPPTRWKGLGGRSPPRKYVHPVGVRRSRIDGRRRDGERPPGGQGYGETRFPSVHQGCRNINQQV